MLESDSETAVFWANGTEDALSVLAQTINSINNLISSIEVRSTVDILYSHRLGNGWADNLAKSVLF